MNAAKTGSTVIAHEWTSTISMASSVVFGTGIALARQPRLQYANADDQETIGEGSIPVSPNDLSRGAEW